MVTQQKLTQTTFQTSTYSAEGSHVNRSVLQEKEWVLKILEELSFLTSQGLYYVNKVRKLTPVECARLQGFPDDWCDGLSDHQAYKCYGNAVTVNVIESIMTKVFSRTTPQQYI